MAEMWVQAPGVLLWAICRNLGLPLTVTSILALHSEDLQGRLSGACVLEVTLD